VPARIVTFMFELAWCGEITLCLMYWPFVFPNIPEDYVVPLWIDLSLHMMLSVALVVDHSLSRSVFVARDAIGTSLINSLYLIVLLVGTLTYQTIYPYVTFDNVFTYVLVISSLCSQLGMFKLGHVIHCYKNREDLEPTSASEALIGGTEMKIPAWKSLLP
jgi:hypothetical protein